MSKKNRKNKVSKAKPYPGFSQHASRVCRHKGLFLLVEADAKSLPRDDKWVIYSANTGEQVATYHPRSRNLYYGSCEVRYCHHWRRAIETVANGESIKAKSCQA